MARIIDKIVVSTTTPTNKNTMWIKPLGNMKYSIFLFVNNTWSSVGSSGSTAPAGYEEFLVEEGTFLVDEGAFYVKQ